MRDKEKLFDEIMSWNLVKTNELCNCSYISRPSKELFDYVFKNDLKNGGYIRQNAFVYVLDIIDIDEEILNNVEDYFKNRSWAILPDRVASRLIRSDAFTEKYYHGHEDFYKNYYHLIRKYKDWAKDDAFQLYGELTGAKEALVDRIRGGAARKITSLKYSKEYILKNFDCFNWDTIMYKYQNVRLSDTDVEKIMEPEIANKIFENFFWKETSYNSQLFSDLEKFKSIITFETVMKSIEEKWPSENPFDATVYSNEYGKAQYRTWIEPRGVEYKEDSATNKYYIDMDAEYSDWPGIALLTFDCLKDTKNRKMYLEKAKKEGFKVPELLFDAKEIIQFNPELFSRRYYDILATVIKVKSSKKKNLIFSKTGYVFEVIK